MIQVNYSDAIRHLVPDSQFSYDNDDLDTLVWDGPQGKQPTKQQIIDAVKIVEELNKQKAEAKATAKAALLTQLGITEEQAKLLLA
jgi:hypothetical protein